MSTKNSILKLVALGGLNEIGKNMAALEWGNDIIVIDCGASFPDDEMPGVDLVIPDISYLQKNKSKVKGIVLTHGHEDHIGALPYILKQLNVPVYGTCLTLGLVEGKLKEHNLGAVKLERVKPKDVVKIGHFSVEFIKTSHSIADSVGLAIGTPVGTIVHTGDFKVDYTPIDGEAIDLARFAEIGQKGVLALLAESTNVERPGYTMSERTVGQAFESIFSGAKGRIIVATFASNVHRIQQIFNAAAKYDRKVCVSGRSMINVITIATELGYLTYPKNMIFEVDQINNFANEQIVVITTGSQGEPMSALARMASSEHKKIDIIPGDTVIISATPIPGNEKLVYRVINQLYAKGANVLYQDLADIHVSGHACQEELKLIHALVKPKFFVPVHGEYRHLKMHANLAESLGMKKENIFTIDIGSVLEFDKNSCKPGGNVTAGRVLVDGLGIGDVGNIVLRDRKHLSQDGLIVVVVTIAKDGGSIIAGPDIISRGFVYVRESELLIDMARDVVKEILEKYGQNGSNGNGQRKFNDWSALKTSIRDRLREFLYVQTKRNPMILPVIMEI